MPCLAFQDYERCPGSWTPQGTPLHQRRYASIDGGNARSARHQRQRCAARGRAWHSEHGTTTSPARVINIGDGSSGIVLSRTGVLANFADAVSVRLVAAPRSSIFTMHGGLVIGDAAHPYAHLPRHSTVQASHNAKP